MSNSVIKRGSFPRSDFQKFITTQFPTRNINKSIFKEVENFEFINPTDFFMTLNVIFSGYPIYSSSSLNFREILEKGRYNRRR